MIVFRDVNLHYDVYAAEVMNMDKPAVVVCHGLFGSKTNWQSLCKQMNKVTGRKVGKSVRPFIRFHCSIN